MQSWFLDVCIYCMNYCICMLFSTIIVAQISSQCYTRFCQEHSVFQSNSMSFSWWNQWLSPYDDFTPGLLISYFTEATHGRFNINFPKPPPTMWFHPPAALNLSTSPNLQQTSYSDDRLSVSPQLPPKKKLEKHISNVNYNLQGTNISYPPLKVAGKRIFFLYRWDVKWTLWIHPSMGFRPKVKRITSLVYDGHFRCQLLHLTNIWVSHAPTWEAKQAQWKSRNTKLRAAKFDSKVRGE